MLDLKTLRTQKGIEQKETASSVGVSQAIVSQWESGRKKPGLEHIVKLSELYNVSIDYIVKILLHIPIYEGMKIDSVHDLTVQETHLLSIFRKLNEAGKNEVAGYADYILSKQPQKVLPKNVG